MQCNLMTNKWPAPVGSMINDCYLTKLSPMSGPMAKRPGTAEVWCVNTSTLTGLLREISQPGEMPSSRAVGPRNERLALDPIRTNTTEA